MQVIESITIRYFRSIYTLTLPQCKDLTVIAGKNDVGKSNILKALNLFFCRQSDYLHPFDFNEDYSLERKEDVRKETIRGQQFISISIRFLRGDRMKNSLPPAFTVTRRWDMHSQEYKETSDVQKRMEKYAKKMSIKYSPKTTTTFLSTFLNKIQYIYIPAIKDDNVFRETLNLLQNSLFNSINGKVLDAPVAKANDAIHSILCDLHGDFERATGIKNSIDLPQTLNYARGLLQVNTKTNGGDVAIQKRGDGIKAHFIPKILNYIASKSNKIFIWGFEEPENSYEYRRCIQVAREFDHQYSTHSQIFITSHSPAFFCDFPKQKNIIRVGCQNGRTIILDSDTKLEEELGYIELYREFIKKVDDLQKQNIENQETIRGLQESISALNTPIVFTEGKSDAILLKTAVEKLNLSQYSDWNFQTIIMGKTSNNNALLLFLESLRDNKLSEKLVIGLFDRDTELKIDDNGRRIDIRDYEFVKICDNVYAVALPIPSHRGSSDPISLEHFFTDKEIKTEYRGKRLYLGNEFHPTGVCISHSERFYRAARNVCGTIKIVEQEGKTGGVTGADGNGSFAISKVKFAENIQNNVPPFDKISFREFSKIFDIFNRILSATNKAEAKDNVTPQDILPTDGVLLI